jgi:uncharacterized protein YggT (Ycf19 family)
MTDGNKMTEIRSEEWEPEHERQIFTFKATQLVWLLLGILEGLLALRVLLKLIAANPGSPIAVFIYTVTGLFLGPFRGLTPTPAVGGMVLEISTLFAMLIYGLIGWAVERLIWLIFFRPHGPVVEIIKTKSHESPTHHPETPE